MRVLVTGGAGFVGSCYVRTLLANGYPEFHDAEVTVLDSLTYAGNPRNLPLDHPRLTMIKGDIRDHELLRLLLPGHGAVVHFAAASHVDRSLTDPGEFTSTNVQGTQILLDACLAAGVPRVLHVSTDEVYGSIESGSWTEREPLQPNSPYAASKAGADLVAHAYWRTHGLDVRITRCTNNYGPYQHPEKLIPLFTTNLLVGEPVPLYGDGRNVREWVHVEDHCRGIQQVLIKGAEGQIYNIGGGAALTNRELTGRLLDLCGADWSLVRRVPDRKGHDLRYAIDDSRIRSELGYAPRRRFEEGLREVVQWYRENSTWWRPARATLGDGPKGLARRANEGEVHASA
jgi:dTDP-glucose 4,6-dehydratase